jgi:hypothetical protein
VDAAVVYPPEIFVAADLHAVGFHHLVGVTAFFDPGFRHNLFVVPATVKQIE